MVEVEDLLAGDYVDAELVANSKSKKLKILDDGKRVETDWGMKIELPVSIDGVNKLWRLNKTSMQHLSEDFKSTDTKNWVGKNISVSVKTINGKMSVMARKCIDLEMKETGGDI